MSVILDLLQMSEPLVPQEAFFDGTRLDKKTWKALIDLVCSKGNSIRQYQVVKDGGDYILFPIGEMEGVLRHFEREQSPNWPHWDLHGTPTWSIVPNVTFISMLVNEFGTIQEVTLVSPPGNPVKNFNLKIDFLDSSMGKIVSSLDSSNVKVVRNA